MATTTLTPQQQMQLAQYLARMTRGRQSPQQFPTYEAWLAQRTGVGNPSGQPLTYEQWMAQRAQATGQQPPQQAPQQNSSIDTATDFAEKKGQKWLTDKAESAILGQGTPGAGLTETTQAAWNAPGLAASGAAPTLGAAGATTAASAAMVPTVAGGIASIPAGAAIPAGWVGVGSAAGGGTMVAPAASAAAGGAGTAGGSTLGAAAGAAWPIAAIATAVMSGMNYAGAKKNANGTGLTKDEVRTVYDPWRPMVQKFVPKEIDGPLKKFTDRGPTAMIFNKLLGSGKHEDQIYRDRVRKTLRDNDFTDTDHNIVFNDGTKFNMGLDGGYRDANGLRQFDAGADALQPGNWKGNIIANLNPLGRIIGGARAKSAEDATGYFTKAAITGLDNEEAAMGRVRELYAKSGISADDARKSIDEMEKLGKDADGGLDKQTADIYRHSLNVVYGGQPPAKQGSSMMIPKVPNGQASSPVPTGSNGSWLNNLPPGAMQTAPNFLNGKPLSGQWVGPDGKPVTGVDPGRFAGNKFVTNPAPTTPAPIMIPKRSSTSSPGIGLDGRRISYSR